MGKLIDYLEKRRKERNAALKEVLDKQNELTERRINERKEFRDNLLNDKSSARIPLPLIKSFRGVNTKLPDEEPLGWPKGSVRAIIAMWVTVGYFLITILFGLWIVWYPNLSSVLSEMWRVLTGIVAIIWGGYFYSRFRMGSIG